MAEIIQLGKINTTPLEKEFGKLKTDEIIITNERIDHIKDVVRYLRPADKITQSHNETRNSNSKNIKTSISYKEQKRRDQQSGRYLGSKVATGAVAGAVVGSVVASAVGVTVATGAVAGAVVGGVAVSIVSNGGVK